MIKEGEQVFGRDGKLFATVSKDIEFGDKITLDLFDLVEPNSLSSDGKWPIELTGFLLIKQHDIMFHNQRVRTNGLC